MAELDAMMGVDGRCRRHGKIICTSCYDEYMASKRDEVARTYLPPSTRVGSPTAGIAGDRRFIESLQIETTTDPITVTTALDPYERVVSGGTRTVIKDQDGELIPEALYDRIQMALADASKLGPWQDRVQRVLDDWNRDIRHRTDQWISERYSADGSERYPQLVMWA